MGDASAADISAVDAGTDSDGGMTVGSGRPEDTRPIEPNEWNGQGSRASAPNAGSSLFELLRAFCEYSYRCEPPTSRNAVASADYCLHLNVARILESSNRLFDGEDLSSYIQCYDQAKASCAPAEDCAPLREDFGALDGECCDSGLTCRRRLSCARESSDVTGLCVGPQAQGAMCRNDAQCDLGLYCDLQQGVCETRAAVDDVCTSSLPCEEQLYCAAGRCAPRVGFDAACGSNDACTDELVCLIQSNGFGRCRTPDSVPEGEFCRNDNRYCQPGLQCTGFGVDASCQPIEPRSFIGQPCGDESRSCVMGSYCDGGACKHLPVRGEPCFSTSLTEGCLDIVDSACIFPSESATQGTCEPRIGGGASCEGIVGFPCETQFRCRSGSCVPWVSAICP
jgi:hypothetical protein